MTPAEDIVSALLVRMTLHDPLLSLLLEDVVEIVESSPSRSRSPPLRRPPPGRCLRRLLKDPSASTGEDKFETVESSFELRNIQMSTMRRVVHCGLPMSFEHCGLAENCSQTLQTLIQRHDVDLFYIGATVDPVRRWLGSACTARGEEPMLGHGRGGWSWMFLIALQTDARQLEKRLIMEAKHQWPRKCTNVAEDSRGQCRGPNWIYVCTNDLAKCLL